MIACIPKFCLLSKKANIHVIKFKILAVLHVHMQMHAMHSGKGK